MKKILLSFLFVGLILACTSSPKSGIGLSPDGDRSPSNQYANQDEQKDENRFQTAVSNPDPAVAAEEVHEFLERLMQYTYISQGILREFDQEINKLTEAKKQDGDNNPDQKRLDEIKVKMSVAWENYEKHLHTVNHIYMRLREEAAKVDSPYQTTSRYALSSLQKVIDENWRTGDHWTLLLIIRGLQAADEQLQAIHGPQTKLAFMVYYSKKIENKKELMDAKSQSEQFQKNRKKTKIDRFYDKEWSAILSKRKSEIEAERAQDRQPNADVLFPSPGGNGQITGNMFAHGFWAITFDDGPHPTYTQGMLDAMNSGGYDGTFFWLTKNMQLYKSLVSKVATEGFRRGSHSYTHANLPTLNAADLHHEINDAYDGFAEIVGEPPTLFRCPYGACGGSNSTIRRMIADKKMMHVLWNVDSLDWQDLDPNSIFDRVKKQMEVLGRGIVLFHDIHPQSVKAVQLMVDWLHKEKTAWKLLTMEEMIRHETNDSKSPSKNYHSP